MPRKRDERTGQSDRKRLVPCTICEEETRPGYIHCVGSKAAYGCRTHSAHHGAVLWGRCWKCSADMGCCTCIPGKTDEYGRPFCDDLVCKPCRVKANRESLLNGGPLATHWLDFDQEHDRIIHGKIAKPTPDLNKYPQDWVRAYATQRAQVGLSVDVDEEAEFREVLRVLRGLAIMPTATSRRELQAERNRQVEELAKRGGSP